MFWDTGRRVSAKPVVLFRPRLKPGMSMEHQETLRRFRPVPTQATRSPRTGHPGFEFARALSGFCGGARPVLLTRGDGSGSTSPSEPGDTFRPRDLLNTYNSPAGPLPPPRSLRFLRKLVQRALATNVYDSFVFRLGAMTSLDPSRPGSTDCGSFFKSPDVRLAVGLRGAAYCGAGCWWWSVSRQPPERDAAVSNKGVGG